MDKIIIKKAENIDLIENDQEILDQKKNDNGVPRIGKDRKFRPSELRKLEQDWQRDELNQNRGPDSDTDHMIAYPSVSDEVDVKWNAGTNHYVDMVSAKADKVRFKYSAEPQVSESGQLYFPAEDIGEIPPGFEMQQLSHKNINELSKLLGKPIDVLMQEGLSNAGIKGTMELTDVLDKLGLKNEEKNVLQSLYSMAFNTETEEYDPKYIDSNSASDLDIPPPYFDTEDMKDEFLQYLNDESILYESIGINDNPPTPGEDAIDISDYEFNYNLRVGDGAQLQDESSYYIEDLKDVPIMLFDDNGTNFIVPFNTILKYNVIEDNITMNYNVDKFLYVYIKDMRKLKEKNAEEFFKKLYSSKIPSSEKLNLLSDSKIEVEKKIDIINIKKGSGRDYYSVDFKVETPVFSENKSARIFEDFNGKGLKSMADMKWYVGYMYDHDGVEPGIGEIDTYRESKMIQKKSYNKIKTKKIFDKVLIKQDDVSGTSDNYETINTNNEYRITQDR